MKASIGKQFNYVHSLIKIETEQINVIAHIRVNDLQKVQAERTTLSTITGLSSFVCLFKSQTWCSVLREDGKMLFSCTFIFK